MTSYHAMHRRIWRTKGKAARHSCQHCGQPAHHWAYDGKDPNELTGTSNQSRDRRQVPVRYSTKLEHYIPLCRSCHTTLDSRPRPVTCPACAHTFTPGKTQRQPGERTTQEPRNKPVTRW